MKIYSVYDKKAESFSPPYVAHNDLIALRNFEGSVNNPEFPISKYPDDFALYYLGNIGDMDGRYFLSDDELNTVMPKLIGEARDYVVKSSEKE